MGPSSRVSRRNFIKAAALGGTAVSSAPALGEVPGANDRINVGLIGIGSRGTDHLDLLLQRREEKRDIEIVALCEVYQKRLNAASAKVPGAKTYVHHQELLERKDIDAIFIATPDHWHAAITLAAMEGGKDVYVEKPMTHTVEESKTVAHRAKDLNRVVQVGVQALSWNRWHKIRDVVQSGMIGQVVAVQGTYSWNTLVADTLQARQKEINTAAGPEASGENHIDWEQWLGPAPHIPFNADRFFHFRRYWDYSGGIATDLHYHIVAPFHVAVANDFPTRVVGMGGLWVYQDGRDIPDTFLTAADYPSKFSLTVQSSHVNENGPEMMIRGTKATIHLDDEWEAPPSRKFDYADVFPESPFVEEFVKKNGNYQVRVEGVGGWYEDDIKHVDNFFDCMRSRKQPNCHADLGYKVSVTIDLSVRSYREGKVYYFDAEREQVSDKAS
jgi:predicted dehydrogenase